MSAHGVGRGALFALATALAATSLSATSVTARSTVAPVRSAAGPTPAPPTPVVVGRDVRATGTPLTLRVVNVTDGRCPPEAQCVWEGDVTVRVRITRPRTASRTVTLTMVGSTGRRGSAVAAVPGWSVALAAAPGERVHLGRGGDPLVLYVERRGVNPR